MRFLPQPLTLRDSEAASDHLESLNEHSRAVVESLEARPEAEHRELEVDGGDTNLDIEVSGRVVSVSLAYVAEADDPGAAAPSSGSPSVGSVSTEHALTERLFATAFTEGETEETSIGRVGQSGEVTTVYAVPDGALTADDTDYVVITVGKRTSGGARTKVAESTTQTSGSGGTGDWTAFDPVPIEIDSAEVSEGDALTLEVTKAGAGVSVPELALTVEYTESLSVSVTHDVDGPPELHWRPIEGGIRITRFYNLTSGTRYAVRLRIERA